MNNCNQFLRKKTFNHGVASSIPKLHKYIDEGDYSIIIIIQEVMALSVLLAAILAFSLQ